MSICGPWPWGWLDTSIWPGVSLLDLVEVVIDLGLKALRPGPGGTSSPLCACCSNGPGGAISTEPGPVCLSGCPPAGVALVLALGVAVVESLVLVLLGPGPLLFLPVLGLGLLPVLGRPRLVLLMTRFVVAFIVAGPAPLRPFLPIAVVVRWSALIVRSEN